VHPRTNTQPDEKRSKYVPQSARETTYRAFLAALLKGSAAGARQHVASGFRANLGDTLPNLSFAELLKEIQRQRSAFPDLGKNIQVADVSEDDGENRLVITYSMTVTFSGTLTSADGKRSVPGTGERIKIPSQDRVDFDPSGKIREIEIVTDMGHTLTQMLPPK
jgi:hypothetical protein